LSRSPDRKLFAERQLLAELAAVTPGGLGSVRVARSLDELDALLGETDPIPWSHPDPNPEYFRTVLGALPGASPHVVKLERGGRAPVMAVARLERIELEAQLGYLSVYRPSLRCLTVLPGGVAGAETAEDCAHLLAVLRKSLADGEADVLRFLALPVDSPMYAAAAGLPPWPCRDHGAVPVPHWRAAVPGQMSDFLAKRSRNTRQNLKRYGKRFEKEYGGRLSVRRFGRGADFDRLCADLEVVASKTYQRGLGVGFMRDELGRRLIQLGLQRGRYLAWVLDVDGVPSAFWDGIVHARSFFIGSPGYDPAFAGHRIGRWLQMRMMEDLCARDDIDWLDYGIGDAQYKRSFGDECRLEATLHVFAPTLEGLRANAARSAVTGATRAVRWALGTGFEARLKRSWRRRAARQASLDRGPGVGIGADRGAVAPGPTLDPGNGSQSTTERTEKPEDSANLVRLPGRHHRSP
jgi:hypothetical protein